MTNLLLSCFLSIFLPLANTPDNQGVEVSDTDSVSVSIAPFHGNARAALSLTYDDGCIDQYELIAPRMDSLGLRGTFFLIGKGLGEGALSWDKIISLDRRGHEIGNHGWTHTDLRKIPSDSVRSELRLTSDLIASHIGHRPLSIAPPFNSYDGRVLDIAGEFSIAVRTFQKGLGQGKHFGQGQRYTDFPAMKSWIDGIVRDGKWGVTMVHGIRDGWDKWEHEEDYWNFLKYAASLEGLWAATFAEVAAYRKEAAECSLKVERCPEGALVITPQCNLDPKLYTMPLTLVIRKGEICETIDIDPFGAPVIYFLK